MITGRLSGTAIPAEGTGEAIVRAVNTLTGRVAAADPVDATGRYRVTVPKGVYALLATVVAPGQPLLRPAATRVRIKNGQRKVVTVPARRKRVTATSINPRVAIRDGAFIGATGSLAVLNKGMGDMLITDLVNASRPRGCTITMIEVSDQFEAAYRRELDLARRGLVDPATAIRPGLRLRPTRGIRGIIALRGDRLTISAEVYRWSNGRTLGRVSVGGPAASVFELEKALARKLVDLLCQRPPPRITGQFSGSVDYSKLPVAPVNLSISWDGSLVLVPQTSIGGVPVPGLPGLPVSYVVQSGTLSARLTGSTSDCTITGQGSFDAARLSAPVDVLALAITEGDPDTYRLAMGPGSATLDTVLSNCTQPDKNGQTGKWPLAAVVLMDVTKEHQIVPEGVLAGSGAMAASVNDGEYAWSWSFRM